jgi:hypothetical protein
MLHELGLRAALLAAAGAGLSALAMRRFGSAGRARRAMNLGGAPLLGRSDAVSMAIVPWGILVQPDVAPRVLRWAAVKEVHVEMIHTRDGGGTPTTLWSVVTIETEHELLAGRTPGAVYIERLIAHVSAYADEQAQAIALDVKGSASVNVAFEPVVEPLLSAARTSLAGVGPDSTFLGLPASGYRRASGASQETVGLLRQLLSDRAPRSPDPRPLAAVLCAELGISSLAGELVALVQSPHPILAAVAKAAAHKLGAVAAKVGAISEVAPFLDDRDVEALAAWAR